MTTARNRAIDRIRRDRTLAAKTRLLQTPEAAEDRVDARALELVHDDAERRLLERRLAELGAATGPARR
ncbi:MAG: hypothetical protein ACR2L8_07880 [Solirubrobacteraceae bacterium]